MDNRNVLQCEFNCLLKVLQNNLIFLRLQNFRKSVFYSNFWMLLLGIFIKNCVNSPQYEYNNLSTQTIPLAQRTYCQLILFQYGINVIWVIPDDRVVTLFILNWNFQLTKNAIWHLTNGHGHMPSQSINQNAIHDCKHDESEVINFHTSRGSVSCSLTNLCTPKTNDPQSILYFNLSARDLIAFFWR